MHTKKRILMLLLGFVFVLSSFVFIKPENTYARTLMQVEADLKENEQLLASLQKEQASIKSDINKTSGLENATKKDLKLYLREIENLETEIDLTEETIESYKMKIADINTDIYIQEENLSYYQNMYDSIVRYSFIQGDISIFELLFESDSFSDFLTRLDNITYFIDYTDSVLESIKDTKESLEKSYSEHKSAMVILEEYNAELEEKKDNAEIKRTQLEQRAVQLGEDIKKIQSDYSSTSSLIGQIKTKISKLKKERQAILDADKDYGWPLGSSVSYYISSRYGWRSSPFGGGREFHNGIDLACSYGSSIIATKSGTVSRSEYAGGYGNLVVIYHGNGLSSYYAHCSSLLVKAGDTVKQGQTIAKVGSTGRSTGNHLHYGVQVNGTFVDPAKYLPKSRL